MNSKLILNIKKALYYYLNVFNYRGRENIERNSDQNELDECNYENSPIKLGILKEAWHLHSYYIKACHELKVSYRIIDIFQSSWLESMRTANIDALIARPSVQYGPWKDMFDNRIRLLNHNDRIKVFPDPYSLWLWESKLRTIEWLKVIGIPHPPTYIFYNKSEAIKFSTSCNYPIVYKANSGSGSSGVKIFRSSKPLKHHINICFKRGIRTYRKHRLDKEHGYIILQEYLEDVKEWRIIRMGDSFFGYEKIKKGRFHSGSQTFGYGMPPEAVLNFVLDVSSKTDIRYADFDVFVTKEEKVYLNEVQPYFGQKDDRELLRIDGVSGRLTYDETNSRWKFEPGNFCRNNFCNLRITELLQDLK